MKITEIEIDNGRVESVKVERGDLDDYFRERRGRTKVSKTLACDVKIRHKGEHVAELRVHVPYKKGMPLKEQWKQIIKGANGVLKMVGDALPNKSLPDIVGT